MSKRKTNGHGERGHNSGYRFMVEGKDEIIYLIKSECQRQDGSMQLHRGYIANLARDAGISPSTISAWFDGKTVRPQHITVRMVLSALDCKLKVVRNDGTEVKARHA